MPTIKFILKDGSKKEVDAPVGLSLMEVAVKNSIPEIEGSCGGSLACATCHVYVEPSKHKDFLPDGGVTEEEEDMLDLAFDLRKTSRLCCQIIVTEDMEGLELGIPGSKTDW